MNASLKKSAVLLLVTSLFVSGCATIHPGLIAVSLNKGKKLPLKISARSVEETAGNAFQLIEITLENESDEWVRIAQSDVVFGVDQPKLSVVVGQDLKTWAEAYENKNNIEAYNQQMLQMGLVSMGLVAALVGAKNSDSTLALTGKGLVAVGSGLAITKDINKRREAVEMVTLVPEGHIFQPFSVPGKMFLRRWILLNKPSNVAISTLVMKFDTVEGEKDMYAIPLN